MLILDKDLCISCGVCEDCCPFGSIVMEDGYPVVGDSCTLCGTCVDNCSVSALSIKVEKKQKANLADWKGVAVFCEFRKGKLADVALELLGEGRKLADLRGVTLAAILIGSEVEGVPEKLIGHGADKVYVIDDPRCQNFCEDIYTDAMTALLEDIKPEIVLAGATAIGRSFVPAVAVRMNAGLTADCTALAIREGDGALLQTRPAFGGNIMATIVCEASRPQMSTVRPKVMKALPFDAARNGEIITVDCSSVSEEQCKIEVLDTLVSEEDDVNIQEADILIGGGRGLSSAEAFSMLEELAELLEGKVSASRAVVDAGWISYPHQVGQTGKTVAPKLYIACGISGAVQHVAGMSSAETIVAINRDQNAPIFDVADYGIVGDLQEILPKLIARVKEQRS